MWGGETRRLLVQELHAQGLVASHPTSRRRKAIRLRGDRDPEPKTSNAADVIRRTRGRSGKGPSCCAHCPARALATTRGGHSRRFHALRHRLHAQPEARSRSPDRRSPPEKSPQSRKSVDPASHVAPQGAEARTSAVPSAWP